MSSPSITIDRERLVDWASRAIATPSFTGSERAMAELMRDTFEEMGLAVQWQQVEDGRANVLGITASFSGDGPRDRTRVGRGKGYASPMTVTTGRVGAAIRASSRSWRTRPT